LHQVGRGKGLSYACNALAASSGLEAQGGIVIRKVNGVNLEPLVSNVNSVNIFVMNDAALRRFHHGDLRRALIEAALAAPDIETLSLRQLATTVGVSAPAVYRHFESREALLNTLADIGFRRLENDFAEAFDPARPAMDAVEARARLMRLGAAYLDFADAEPALWRLMFGVNAAGYRSAATPDGRTTTYNYLPLALQDLHRTGVVAAPPSERDALFAWSAIHGLATLRAGAVTAACGPAEEVAASVVKHIFRALGATEPA
jgi:AcrR family transcriptional regulator